MTGSRDPRPAPSVPPGLCGGCRHSRRIETRNGAVFRLCERSTSDPAYPRYPALPVRNCPGFVERGRALHVVPARRSPNCA